VRAGEGHQGASGVGLQGVRSLLSVEACWQRGTKALQRLQHAAAQVHRQQATLLPRRAADQLGLRFLAEKGRQEISQGWRQVVGGGVGKGVGGR
jgi:hypothetical protein